MSGLELEIDECKELIEEHLSEKTSREYEEVLEIEKEVACYLESLKMTKWIYDDDISGPQIEGVSEEAMLRIALEGKRFCGKYQLGVEYDRGVRCFCIHNVGHQGKIAWSIDIKPRFKEGQMSEALTTHDFKYN